MRCSKKCIILSKVKVKESRIKIMKSKSKRNPNENILQKKLKKVK